MEVVPKVRLTSCSRTVKQASAFCPNARWNRAILTTGSMLPATYRRSLVMSAPLRKTSVSGAGFLSFISIRFALSDLMGSDPLAVTTVTFSTQAIETVTVIFWRARF